jgi:hypothetical protein
VNDSRRDAPPADLEIAGGVRATGARWHRKARPVTITAGDVETKELRDREPEHPETGRTYRNIRRVWGLRAWLADALHRGY